MPSGGQNKIILTTELADKIVEGLASQFLTTLCSKKGMPSTVTVWKWMNEYPDFAIRVAHARQMYYEVLLEQSTYDLRSSKTLNDGKLADIKLKSTQWLAERLLSKKYAPAMKVKGDAEEPVQITIRHITGKSKKE